MSLEQVFDSRVKRAASVFKNPKAGPSTINFTSAELSVHQSLIGLHGRFPRAKPGVFYLYQLSFDGEGTAVASQARKAFRAARARGLTNMSKDNTSHPDSRTLYVGVSEDMYARFRTHLGVGKGTTTWALYLAAWAGAINAKFVVEYYEFTETVAKDVELIEGVLWDHLLPLFGKKGGM